MDGQTSAGAHVEPALLGKGRVGIIDVGSN
jgi:hypothetical protein